MSTGAPLALSLPVPGASFPAVSAEAKPGALPVVSGSNDPGGAPTASKQAISGEKPGASEPKSVLKPQSRVTPSVRTKAAPPLSFHALFGKLSDPALDPHEGASVLAAHMRAVNEVLSTATVAKSAAEASGASQGETVVVPKRSGSASPDYGDEPSSAELSHADTISRSVGVPRGDGLLLLRDYLSSTFGEVEARRLLASTDASLFSAAPLSELEAFYYREQRYAYACAAKLFFNGAGMGCAEPCTSAFKPLLAEHAPEITRIATDQALTVINAYSAPATPEIAHLLKTDRFGCVMELFFAVTHCQGLVPKDIRHIVESIMGCVKQAAGNRYLARRYVGGSGQRALLDGSRYTLLLCATFGSAVSALRWSSAAEGGERNDHDVHSLLVRGGRTIGNFDLDAMRDINKLLLDGPEDTVYAELAIFRVIWGSFVAAHSSDVISAAPEVRCVAHAEYAFRFDTNLALRVMLEEAKSSAAPDVCLEDAMRLLYWNAFHTQLVGFPPTQFPRTPEEVEDDVKLAVAILSGCGTLGAEIASRIVWQREYSDEMRWVGMNSLLRMASAVFPLRYFPLVSLLSEICADSDSSVEVFTTVAQRLFTRTEALDDRMRGIVRPLSEEMQASLYEEAGTKRGLDVNWFFRSVGLIAVGNGDGRSCLVTLTQDWPSNYGNALTADESFGLLVESNSFLSWGCRWNGWQAVTLALRSLLQFLTQPGTDIEHTESDMADLTSSSLKSLHLIERLCLAGNSETRRLLCENFASFDLLDLVSDIFVAAADPPRTDTWITSSTRATVMSAAGTCLHALTSSSTMFAQSVVERIVLSSARSNALQACVTSLGYTSFPALSSVAKIATTALLGSEPIRSSQLDVTMSDMYASGDGRSGSGASGVANFIQAIGLPLWLSLFQNQSFSAKPGVFANPWLLPAVSFELFSRKPEIVLNAPVVASVVSATMVSVVSSGYRAGHGGGDSFHYAAFCNAVTLCIAVLEYRNAHLDDLAAISSADDLDGAKAAALTPLAFERMLLTPEVVHALAVVASGASGTLAVLERAAVSSADFRRDVDYASLCKANDSQQKDVIELQDMAARCLSLFVSCLFKMSKVRGDQIIQVPWPAMGHSSLGCWFGGGKEIRRGFAGRVVQSSNSDVADFIATIVSCGQRAAARSIFGPTSGKPKPLSDALQSEEDARRENGMLAAVVDKLAASHKSWLELETDVDGKDGALRGEIASSIAACVRILRTSWEVHGKVWLKEAWNILKVWSLLSSLLGSSPQHKSQTGRPSGDDAMNDAGRAKSHDPMDEAALPWTSPRLATAIDSFDTHATWRAIVADVLGVFASEIVFRSNDIAKNPSASQGPSGDGGPAGSVADTTEQRLRNEVFDDPAFTALRDAFSEQWMHRFLDASQLGILQSNVVSFASVDSRHQTVENMTAGINSALAEKLNCGASDVLSFYRRRCGERRPRYGGNYAYGARAIARDLRLAQVQEEDVVSLTGRVIILNLLWSRADAQLKLCKSFSALTTMMVMADLRAPAPAKMLTYASPQYCGKLCRVITYSMAIVTSNAMASPSIAFIHLELAMLLGFVSARLSPEELDQAALSAVRLDTSVLPSGSIIDVSSTSPISRIAELIRRTSELVKPRDPGARASPVRIAVIRWLLHSGARLAAGAAFCSERDISALGEATMVALRTLSSEPEICSAASIALSAVVLSSDVLLRSSFGRQGAVVGVFAAIGSLAQLDHAHQDGSHVAAAANLVLFMTKMASGLTGAGANALLELSALEHLSSGSTAAMLPLGSEPVATYSSITFKREPVHRLWCASLSLASSLISCVEPRVDSSLPPTSHLNGILEFAGSNVSRITTVNLDSVGDWPPSATSNPEDGSGHLRSSRHITMARIEEAEVAMQTVFALANHTLDLRDAFPHVVSGLVSTSHRIAYQVYRLIRAEPIARWVRPVSEEERERCDLFVVGTDGVGLFSHGSSMANSQWPMSPVVSPGGGGAGSDNSAGGGAVGTPGGGASGRNGGQIASPRRTPQQAVRAALGRLGSRSGGSLQVPPSPGMPTTPQLHSPMSVGTAVYSSGPTNKYQSPLSPWGTSGGGLITGSGVYFTEEVSRALLRTMASVLGALRRFSSLLDRPLFAPTMSISEAEPSIGLLVGIQFHACTELQGSCEGDRRDALTLMLENALVLTLSHAALYIKHGDLNSGVRDELHRRLETVVSRMRRLVPPCPSHSIIHTDLEPFLRLLKHA